jgi:hypothetical protein
LTVNESDVALTTVPVSVSAKGAPGFDGKRSLCADWRYG